MAAYSPQRRRYVRRMGVSAAVYVVSLVAATLLISKGSVQGPLAWGLGLLPGLALLGCFYAIGMRIIEEIDEFIRLLIVRQTLFGTALALSLATVWGFLENFELVPHVETYWVAVIWFVGFALGGFVNKLTLGAFGECL